LFERIDVNVIVQLELSSIKPLRFERFDNVD